MLALAPSFLFAEATGVWTALGMDEKTTTRQNWENDELPSGIGLAFGSAGSRALLADTLSASGIQFVPAAAGRTFTLANDASAADGTKYLVGSGGITVSSSTGSNWQTNIVSSPVEFTDSTAALGGSTSTKDVLRVAGPISSSGTVTITVAGADKIYLDAKNDFTGSFKSTRGYRYITGGSLGAAANTATFNQTAGNSTVYFMGGTNDQAITVDRTAAGSASGYNISTYFQESKRHVFNKKFTIKDNNYGIQAFANPYAKVIFNNGLSSGTSDYQLQLYGYIGSSYTITNGPLNAASCSQGVTIYAYNAMDFNLCCSNNFTKENGAYRLVNNVTLNTYAKWAFNTNYVGGVLKYVPLTFLRGSSSSSYNPTLNLRGNDQFVGNLSTSPFSSYVASNAGKITSSKPATLYVWQNAKRTFEPTFEGAVSLCKYGTNTLTLARNSTSTGQVAVADGTLAFAETGAWSKATSVAVLGGTLVLDTADRLNSKADLYLSSGTIDIAEGVTVEVRKMYVSNGNGGWKLASRGVYNAQNMPGRISGLGQLNVRLPVGCVVSFH